jgi:hypothetical protein
MTPAGGLAPGTPNDAQKMINDILTRPRPGGLPAQGAQPIGQTIGGGIAGVASNADEEGIKVYNERTNYKEWEFLYDYTKDRGPAGAAGLGTPVNQLGQQPGQQLGLPGTPLQPGATGIGGPLPSPMGGPGQSGIPQMPPTTTQPFPPPRQ